MCDAFRRIDGMDDLVHFNDDLLQPFTAVGIVDQRDDDVLSAISLDNCAVRMISAPRSRFAKDACVGINAVYAGHELVANGRLTEDFSHNRARLGRHQSVGCKHEVKA